jgi:hypothetical protein
MKAYWEVAMLLDGPVVLLVAAVILSAIWLVVLTGSRYFGSQ